MKIAYEYSHLNGLEYLIVHKKALLDEIRNAISVIDANQYTKLSKDKMKVGKTLYSQKEINDAFEAILFPLGWQSITTPYYVADDIETIRNTISIRDSEEQKRAILDLQHTPMRTNNQVDFVKDRVAVEVQFGKYFSVAYDLHVKHTFFYLRDDIDVGIEILPTQKMRLKMDTGVAWFENEVANVIREGRNNPSVPIYMIGIEPEEIRIQDYGLYRSKPAPRRL